MLAKHRILNLFATTILLAAIVGGFLGFRPGSKRIFEENVRALLPGPSDVPGWNMRYRKLAESIEMERLTQEILEFDDAAFADYVRGNTRISIYVAYWTPGRISSRWVASHTPDVCWAGQGWECQHRDSRVVRNTGDAKEALPVEYRIFRLQGQTEHVIFCHLVGGVSMTYNGVGPLPLRSDIIRDYINTGSLRRLDEEQFFIRISSNESLENFENSTPVRRFLDQLNASYLRKRSENGSRKQP